MRGKGSTGQRDKEMKGTIKEITRQESGFIIYQKSCTLNNWSADLGDYTTDLRQTIQVKNCLAWLIESGWVLVDGDYINKNYQEDADPVSLEALMVEGLLYNFGKFKILAPQRLGIERQ
jgi:hypothetical protein